MKRTCCLLRGLVLSRSGLYLSSWYILQPAPWWDGVTALGSDHPLIRRCMNGDVLFGFFYIIFLCLFLFFFFLSLLPPPSPQRTLVTAMCHCLKLSCDICAFHSFDTLGLQWGVFVGPGLLSPFDPCSLDQVHYFQGAALGSKGLVRLSRAKPWHNTTIDPMFSDIWLKLRCLEYCVFASVYYVFWDILSKKKKTH